MHINAIEWNLKVTLMPYLSTVYWHSRTESHLQGHQSYNAKKFKYSYERCNERIGPAAHHKCFSLILNLKLGPSRYVRAIFILI